MKFLKASVVLFAILLISDPAVIAQVNSEVLKSESTKSTATGLNTGFQQGELPERLTGKSKLKDAAEQVLADCVEKKFDAAMESAKNFAQVARPKREEISTMLSTADSLESTNKEKSLALHLMAYQSFKAGTRASADETVIALFNIAAVANSKNPTDSERQFATGVVEQGLQTRRLAGGIRQSDAPFVLLHAQLEFRLKHWDNAIKEYVFWLGMYSAKGQNPPANELPDALGEVGIAYTNLKNIPKAEEYFSRACKACNAFNETTVTPINQYDVEDFLIFNLLTQNKLDHAKELAQHHLKFKENTLGLRSPQLADELNRYADLFEQAGETSFSYSLRARAGRVVNP